MHQVPTEQPAGHIGRSSRRRLLAGATAAAIVSAGRMWADLRIRRAAAHAEGDPLATTQARLYLAETGHNLAEPFLSRWRDLDGRLKLGSPLSEERYAEGTGGVLQTFESLTLLYDPTRDFPLDVQAQPLSPATIAALAPDAARQRLTGCSSAEDCRFFPETGHTLAGAFAQFWTAHGEEAIVGMPVSEPFVSSQAGTTTQVFERAVLEDHPLAGVRFQPIGRRLAEDAGLLSSPAFQPAPPTGGTTFLVAAEDGLSLRAAPELGAHIVAVLPGNAEFIAAPPWEGDWVPGYADGFSGWVSAGYLREAPPLPRLDLADWNPAVWQGATLGQTNLRAEPTTTASSVGQLEQGDPITVEAWVEGEEVFEGADMWARLGPSRFIYGRNVGRNAPVQPPPLPVDAPGDDRWIDVNLTQQLIVAYDGRTPVRTVVTTTGMPGWETPPGFYRILSRVANETMTSGAIGAESFYRLEDVLFTQYFTDVGHALHFAWWRTKETIGRPGSHGCLNLLLEDARFFWDWATIGTLLFIHP